MGQLKRFENKAQLIRYVAEETGVDTGELWDEYDQQLEDNQ